MNGRKKNSVDEDNGFEPAGEAYDVEYEDEEGFDAFNGEEEEGVQVEAVPPEFEVQNIMERPNTSKGNRVGSGKFTGAKQPTASRNQPGKRQLGSWGQQQSGAPPTHSKPQSGVPSNFPLLNNYHSDPAFAEFTRLRPKNIPMDKERLYEDSLKLKRSNNTLKEENTKLKTRVQTLEREMMRHDRLVDEQDLINPPSLAATAKNYSRGGGPNRDSNLISGLRQQAKELKEEMKARVEELEKAKKLVKYTRVHELEAEVKTYSEETQRLRVLLEQAIKNNHILAANQVGNVGMEDRMSAQVNLINTLRSDNAEMARAIKFLEDELNKMKAMLDEGEKIKQKLLRDAALMRRAVKEKDEELVKKLGPLGLLDSERMKQLSPKVSATQVAERDFRINELERELEHRNAGLNDIRKKLADREEREKERAAKEREKEASHREKEATHKEKEAKAQAKERELSQKLSELEKEKKTEHEELEKERLKAKELAESLSQVQSEFELMKAAQARRSSIRMALGKRLTEQSGDSEQEESEQSDEEEEEPAQKILLPRVIAEDVTPHGLELSQRLRCLRIPLDEAETKLVASAKRGATEISVTKLVHALHDDPFGVDEEACVLLARFMVEEGRDEFIVFNPNTKKEITYVTSVFRKIVGNYRVLSEADAASLQSKLCRILNNHAEDFVDELKNRDKVHKGLLSREDIEATLKLLKMAIIPSLMDYLFLRLYEVRDPISKMYYYEKILEVFPKNEAGDNKSSVGGDLNTSKESFSSLPKGFGRTESINKDKDKDSPMKRRNSKLSMPLPKEIERIDEEDFKLRPELDKQAPARPTIPKGFLKKDEESSPNANSQVEKKQEKPTESKSILNVKPIKESAAHKESSPRKEIGDQFEFDEIKGPGKEKAAKAEDFDNPLIEEEQRREELKSILVMGHNRGEEEKTKHVRITDHPSLQRQPTEESKEAGQQSQRMDNASRAVSIQETTNTNLTVDTGSKEDEESIEEEKKEEVLPEPRKASKDVGKAEIVRPFAKAGSKEVPIPELKLPQQSKFSDENIDDPNQIVKPPQ